MAPNSSSSPQPHRPNQQLLHCRDHLSSGFSFSGSENGNDPSSTASTVDAIHRSVNRESWYQQTLSIIVIGASGDLAKKKTYPSLLSLFVQKLLPHDCIIWGYARSPKTHQELRDHLRPLLLKTETSEIIVNDFLEMCFYHSGKNYGDEHAYAELMGNVFKFEAGTPSAACNRLFYLAVPPNVFGESGIAIKNVGMAVTGWTRLVIEKPFGRDLNSCNELLATLASQFEEDHLYRIDHYLGKEIVQNMQLFRFGNSVWEWMWNRNAIENVTFTFKEPFGTDGRGGYFDNYGIIRDILQNHLLQVLTIFAMEPPQADDGDSIRDAKAEVLNNMEPILLEDSLLGQYEGYADDPTIKNKDTNCPTYAALRCWINTPRWKGVPFILQAGKAMDEKLCEVRVKFRTSSTLESIKTHAKKLSSNELVMRLQPNPSIELHMNMKTPGLASQPTTTAMKMNYNEIPGISNPDAYTRLLLDVLRGRNGSFVRDDELRRSWEIFTPILHSIEQDHVPPHSYKYGSSGPDNRKEWFAAMGKASDEPSLKAPLHSAL